MSADIFTVILETRAALAKARAAITSLGKLPPSPEHRKLMASLHAVSEALEDELKALRYRARQQSEARAS